MSDAGGNIGLTLPPAGFVPSLLGRLLHCFYRLFGLARTDRLSVERIRDTSLVVLPGVFNPRQMRTGTFFSSLLDESTTGQRDVLDLGTGSGVCALFAARHARHVVAIDITAAAVRCARINAQLLQLENRVEVLQGDLFAPVTDRRFDLVLFNPPFLRGEPRDDYDRAWRSTDLPERFAAQLASRLKPGGSALVLLSSFGGSSDFLSALLARGFGVSAHATRRYFNETVTVFRVVPGSAP